MYRCFVIAYLFELGLPMFVKKNDSLNLKTDVELLRREKNKVMSQKT